jgi:hypothetical protein
LGEESKQFFGGNMKQRYFIFGVTLGLALSLVTASNVHASAEDYLLIAQNGNVRYAVIETGIIQARKSSAGNIIVDKIASDGSQTQLISIPTRSTSGLAIESVAVDSSGYIFVSGSIGYGNYINFQPAWGNLCDWLLKVSPTGTKMWLRDWPDTEYASVEAMAPTNSGGAYVLKSIDRSGVGVLQKLDSDGNLVWSQNILPNVNEKPISVRLVSNLSGQVFVFTRYSANNYALGLNADKSILFSQTFENNLPNYNKPKTLIFLSAKVNPLTGNVVMATRGEHGNDSIFFTFNESGLSSTHLYEGDGFLTYDEEIAFTPEGYLISIGQYSGNNGHRIQILDSDFKKITSFTTPFLPIKVFLNASNEICLIYFKFSPDEYRFRNFGASISPAISNVSLARSGTKVAYSFNVATGIYSSTVQLQQSLTQDFETSTYFSLANPTSSMSQDFSGTTDLVAFGRTVYVRIVATNTLGVATSDVVTLNVPNIPAVPVLALERDGNVLKAFWENPDNSGAAISEYEINYSIENSGWYTTMNQMPVNSGKNTFSLISTEINAEAVVSVRVRAVNEIGKSEWSSSAQITWPQIPETPNNLSVVKEGNSFKLNWEVSNSNLADDLNFMFKISTNGIDWSNIDLRLDPSGFGAYFDDAIPGTYYRFKVAASNFLGESSWSQSSSLINLPVVPDILTNIQAIPGNATVDVSWTTNGAGDSIITEYKVDWGTGFQICSSSPCKIINLDNGTQYTFRVQAKNAAGWSETSVSTAVATPFLPARKPSAINIVSTKSSKKSVMSLTWNPSIDNGSAISGYWVRWKLATKGKWSAWKSVGLKTSYQIVGLKKGTSYSLQLKSANAVGETLSRIFEVRQTR